VTGVRTLAKEAFVWEDPGGCISIRITLDVMERLEQAMERGLGAGPRGWEVGGILFGERLPGERRAVRIDDFEPIPSQHLRGASYTLSAKERQALGSRLARRANAVGFFRSHTRPGLYLDQDDLSVFENLFADESQVFLVVRPEANGVPMGGFFFWENGEIYRRSTYRAFPFDSGRLLADGVAIRQAPVTPLAPPKSRTRSSARASASLWAVPAVAGVLLVAALWVSGRSATHRATRPEPETAPVVRVQSRRELPAEPGVETAPVAAAARPPESVAPVEPAPPPTGSPAQPPAMVRKTLPQPAPVTAFVHPLPAREAALPPPPAVQSHPKLAALLPPPNTPPPILHASVSYEEVHPGVFRRAFHRISSLAELHSSDGFVPPEPSHQVAPPVPADGSQAGMADVKVHIDESGSVSRAELLTADSAFAEASLNAARRWRFSPALKHEKPVDSEMLLHFRYN